MERKLADIDNDIARWEAKRAEAIATLGEANAELLTLGSERNRRLGQIASRHLYVVPTVLPVEIPHPDYPSGAA